MQKDGGIRPKLGSKVSLAGQATTLNTVAMVILALNDENCQQKISENFRFWNSINLSKKHWLPGRVISCWTKSLSIFD